MKTKSTFTTTGFVVGRTLPSKLSKQTKDYFNTGATPQKARDLVAKFRAAQKHNDTETKPTRKENAC